MTLNKRLFFEIHSWIGVKLSILFFIVCFSGTLATLSHEMDWLFNSDIRAVPQQKLANRNTIIKNFKKLYPEAEITYWLRPDEPYLCDIIYKETDEKRSYVFANRYTGEIQGESALTVQRFFRDLHYFLFIPFYQIGYFLVLIFAFLLFVSVITPLFFYKKWWEKFFILQKDKGILFFFRSLHRLVGLWAIPFAILISTTGIWYFIERTNIANVKTEGNPTQPKIKIEPELKKLETTALNYDKAVRLAEEEIPNLVVGSITAPKNNTDNIYITGKSNVPLVRQRANRVYINPYTYEVMGVQKAEDINTLMWINDIADPLHFGSWGGLLTKIIWFLFGLCISTLILSGIWIILKRKKAKQKTKVMGKWKYLNWCVSAIIMGFMYDSVLFKYGTSLKVVSIISLGCATFIALGYYIFVYRLNKVVDKD